MVDLPTGTVTFLFTDIEGSTRLWEQHPRAMRVALVQHDEILRQAVEANRGHVFKTGGDGFCVAFDTAPDALAAAFAAQLALQQAEWKEVDPLRVRMALHTGSAEVRDGDYFGPALNRAARLLAAGHGGQLLLSGATRELVQDDLLPGVSLRDLGRYSLRNLQRPEHVFQALHSSLPADFPPLRSARAVPNALAEQTGRQPLDTDQLLRVLRAIKNVEFAVRMPIDRPGVAREIAVTINETLDLLNALTESVTWQLHQLGVLGVLGGQAQLPEASSEWRNLLNSVNLMSANLTAQLRDISHIMIALLHSDFSQKVTVKVGGEIRELKSNLNRLIDQSNAFASELIRITGELGLQGRFGGQAEIPGLSGAWKDVRDSTNLMATILTGQLRNIIEAIWRISTGDLTRKIAVPAEGEILVLKQALNTVVDQLNTLATEIRRIARESREGQPVGRAEVPEASGTWKEIVDNLNGLAGNL